MSTTVTIPKTGIPVGRVTIAGQQYDVQQHPEFVRFWFDLFRRSGGTTALSNTDLQTLAQELVAGDQQSDLTAQAAQRLAEDMHAQIAGLRSALDAFTGRLQELQAQIDELPRAPDLTARVAQLEDRLA